MKKKPDFYPFYEHEEDIGEVFFPLDTPAMDHLIKTDRLEIDDIRYKLECCLDDAFPIPFEDIPLVWWIRHAIERKLLKIGFDKASITDPKKLWGLIQIMKTEQWGGYTGKTPEGFPIKAFRFTEDKKQIWILEDIEAALYALWSYHRLKIAFEAEGNHPAAICALTLQFVIDATRTGLLRKNTLDGQRHSQTQSKKASGPRTVGDVNPEERKKRDDEIRAVFEKTKLTENSFCIDQGKKHNRSPSMIRKIIKS
ncbi:MAG: hypothetical protein C0392_04905 [Syntrophus sp. (in: bacteria)]|nr:hypothetical protein [Syntrophus sp. (in: bacteria)]